MNNKINKMLASLALVGLLGQAAATDYVTVESFQPEDAALTLKAQPLALPRLPVSHSVVLDRLVQTSNSLLDSSIEAKKSQPNTPLQTGFDRETAAAATADRLHDLLQWQLGPTGGYSAAIELTSPGAVASRVVLGVERLHAAAIVRFISGSNDEEVSVTGEEIINSLSLDQSLDRSYVGPILEGESVIVEFHLPQGVRPEDTRLSIPALSHIYADLQELQTYLDAADQSCMVSATCSPEHDNDSKAVAAILFNKEGASYVCTGTLINDTNSTGTANFITANHCIGTQSVASTMESRWFYKTSSCSTTSIDSRVTQVRGGAELLFSQHQSDTTLLRLRGALPRGLLYKGWTTQPVIQNTPVSILHHPAFTYQKITQGIIKSFADCDMSKGEKQFRCSYMLGAMGDGSFIRVDNTVGGVIGGSSGSGLLALAANGQRYYVGTLAGGGASCSTAKTSPDMYGRFDHAYTAGLGAWLQTEPPAVNNNARGAIYRLYHTGKGTHFFTASAAERDSVVSKYPAYVYEGTAFYTYPKTGANLSPVYRFFNSATGAHFYTISQAEKDSIQSKRPNFIYEGVAWYASTKTGAGTQPLYRFFNQKTGTHFYTTSAAEKDNIISKYPSYIYEGIAYHVWPGR